MDENTKTKLYEERLAGLPEDLKTAFFSDTVTDAILVIGKQHGLTIDKVGELGDEVGLVMLGITKTGDFIKNLSSRLAVDKEKAKAIAEDINQKVFQQIRASLKKVHGIPDGAPPSPKPSGAMPAPAAEIPKAPVALRQGEIEPSSQIFAKKIVPIDEILDKIDSGESIIKQKIKIENVPVNLPVEEKPTTPPSNSDKGEQNAQILRGLSQGDGPSRAILQQENMRAGAKSGAEASTGLPSEATLSPDEIKAAVEKALGGKITTKDTNDPYREPLQ